MTNKEKERERERTVPIRSKHAATQEQTAHRSRLTYKERERETESCLLVVSMQPHKDKLTIGAKQLTMRIERRSKQKNRHINKQKDGRKGKLKKASIHRTFS